MVEGLGCVDERLTLLGGDGGKSLAANGEQALGIYADRKGDIDLVLLDLVMPGLNGLQTLERLRSFDPEVKVVLCSGLGDTEEENLPQGVSFIPKPLPLETLSQKVAAALGA